VPLPFKDQPERVMVDTDCDLSGELGVGTWDWEPSVFRNMWPASIAYPASWNVNSLIRKPRASIKFWSFIIRLAQSNGGHWMAIHAVWTVIARTSSALLPGNRPTGDGRLRVVASSWFFKFFWQNFGIAFPTYFMSAFFSLPASLT
jgi:hypothetical protein